MMLIEQLFKIWRKPLHRHLNIWKLKHWFLFDFVFKLFKQVQDAICRYLEKKLVEILVNPRYFLHVKVISFTILLMEFVSGFSHQLSWKSGLVNNCYFPQKWNNSILFRSIFNMYNPFEKEKIARNVDKQFLTLLGNVMAADCQCLGAADYQYFSLEISQFLLREIKMKVAFYYVIYVTFCSLIMLTKLAAPVLLRIPAFPRERFGRFDFYPWLHVNQFIW